MPARFEGFTPQALQFLADLRDHNHRDWFLPRKGFYESEIKAPMELFVNELAAAGQTKGMPMYPKQRSPVSRIYRDTRFHPGRGPFQWHVGGTLHGRANGLPFGELYLHVTPGHSFIAAGYYMPDPAFLRLIRLRIAEQPEPFLKVAAALQKKGLPFSTEWQLKRLPRGFERFANTPQAPFLKLNALVVVQKLEDRSVTSRDLLKLSTRFALDARPLLEYGWNSGFRPAVKRCTEFA